MRKILIATAACMYIVGFCALGHCQDDGAIEQSESQIGQNLDSEMSREEAPNAVEEGEANSEYDSGEKMSF